MVPSGGSSRSDVGVPASVRDRELRHSAQVRRVTWIGLSANVGLSALKLTGGLLGGSQAVVADAVHSLSDTTAATVPGSGRPLVGDAHYFFLAPHFDVFFFLLPKHLSPITRLLSNRTLDFGAGRHLPETRLISLHHVPRGV